MVKYRLISGSNPWRSFFDKQIVDVRSRTPTYHVREPTERMAYMLFLTNPVFWIGFVLCSIWMLNDFFLLLRSVPKPYTWPQAAVGIALNIAVAALAYYTFIVVGMHRRHYVQHNVLVVASFVWAICALRTAWWLKRPRHLGQWNLRCAAWLAVSGCTCVITLTPIVY